MDLVDNWIPTHSKHLLHHLVLKMLTVWLLEIITQQLMIAMLKLWEILYITSLMIMWFSLILRVQKTHGTFYRLLMKTHKSQVKYGCCIKTITTLGKVAGNKLITESILGHNLMASVQAHWVTTMQPEQMPITWCYLMLVITVIVVICILITVTVAVQVEPLMHMKIQTHQKWIP